MQQSTIATNSELPKRIKIRSLVSSRYLDGKRPLSWDERIPGIDTVIADDGVTYKLQSDGGQSPPQKGWVILLNSGDSESGYNWTLYGITEDLAN